MGEQLLGQVYVAKYFPEANGYTNELKSAYCYSIYKTAQLPKFTPMTGITDPSQAKLRNFERAIYQVFLECNNLQFHSVSCKT